MHPNLVGWLPSRRQELDLWNRCCFNIRLERPFRNRGNRRERKRSVFLSKAPGGTDTEERNLIIGFMNRSYRMKKSRQGWRLVPACRTRMFRAKKKCRSLLAKILKCCNEAALSTTIHMRGGARMFEKMRGK